MEMNPVFTFGRSIKRGTAWIETTNDNPGFEVINCTTCRVRGLMPLRAGVRPRAALQVTKRGTVDDILFLGPGLFAFSQRAQDVVISNRLSGISFVPLVSIEYASSGITNGAIANTLIKANFRIAYITGYSGSTALSSNVKVRTHCQACGWIGWSPRPKLLKIDRRHWDGSDFFRIDEYRSYFFTQRAANTLATAAMSNFTADPSGYFVDADKSMRRPKKSELIDLQNLYVLSAIYGSPRDRSRGRFAPFWKQFFLGQLGELTFRNALSKLKALHSKDQYTIKGWPWSHT